MLTVSSILALLLAMGQDDARILSTGNLDARRDALARIIAMTPAERTPDLWRALRQEVDPLTVLVDFVTTRRGSLQPTFVANGRGDPP